MAVLTHHARDHLEAVVELAWLGLGLALGLGLGLGLALGLGLGLGLGRRTRPPACGAPWPRRSGRLAAAAPGRG